MDTIKFNLKWTEVDDAVNALGDALYNTRARIAEHEEAVSIQLQSRDIDKITSKLKGLHVDWEPIDSPRDKTLSGMKSLSSDRLGEAIGLFQKAGSDVTDVVGNLQVSSKRDLEVQNRKPIPNLRQETWKSPYSVTDDGSIILTDQGPSEDCAEQIYIANGLAESTGRIGFSLWSSDTDWYGNEALIQETMDRARREATANAIKAIDEFLSSHKYNCPEPCMPQVKIELFEPSLPGPSMGSTTIGEAGAEAGVSGSDPGVTVNSSFGVLYLVLSIRWVAYLVCRKAPDFDTSVIPGDNGIRMGTDEVRTGSCPSWSGWGFRRKTGLLAARKAQDEPWRAPRDPWEVMDAAAIGAARDAIGPSVQDEAYRSAAFAAVRYLQSVGELCPPGCPQTKSQIVLLPWIQFERTDALDRPAGAEGYFLVVDCFWTATHKCSGN
jgi:hypothetical protein